MAIDLMGLTNQHGFYAQHYLEAVVEQDLSAAAESWREAAEKADTDAPDEAVRKLARGWLDAYAEVTDAQGHVQAGVAWPFASDATEPMPDALGALWSPLWQALGYTPCPTVHTGEDGFKLGLHAQVTRPDGAPWLWVIDASNAGEDDPLDVFEEALDRAVFGAAEPPRWAILAHPRQVILLDRGKWNDQRALRFDLPTIFANPDLGMRRLLVAMLGREQLCPEGGGSGLADEIDAQAHKHASGVSEDLKYALREVIERIANEAIWYKRHKAKNKVFEGVIDAEDLKKESLRYAYRLLFLLYIEARPELGYAPMKVEAYRTAYGLEGLRELVDVPLMTDAARDGYYFHHTVAWLFRSVFDGVREPVNHNLFTNGGEPIFELPALRCHLFDPDRTPFLGSVRLRNHVWQRVMRLLSLTQEADDLPSARRRGRKGRISYATLGINQLGAVYEALLSFRGFFAEEDLYEVRPAPKKAKAAATKADEGDDEADEGPPPDEATPELPTRGGKAPAAVSARDPLEQAFFVPASELPRYTEDEKVYNADGTPRSYAKGTFIYRLAGRDREQSASYYTPEVLTQCLVKYALEVLLENKTADEILRLTVCEPAMGSAAFLNEAVNQLARAYLVRKEAELKAAGRLDAHPKLDVASYNRELQKVKMYFADQRVYGIDLNPIAVELAEVSLWLNTICAADAGGQVHVPWFGQQLACGNSLVGARRQVFDAGLLTYKKKADTSWLTTVPERVMPGATRPVEGVYHFLLPDEGMASYTDKVVKGLAPEAIAAINAWRKDFTKPHAPSDVLKLKRLSAAVDQLWETAAREQAELRQKTTDAIQIWGQPTPLGTTQPLTTEGKDALFARVHEGHETFSSPYSRLKLAMDYWCALWFWPIEQADTLPSRDEFLMDLALILEGNPVAVQDVATGEQLSLLPQPRQPAMDFTNALGKVDVTEMVRKLPRLRVVRELAARQHFLHWELEFADLFAEREGFDLVLGNPPWLKPIWDEGGLMGDYEPLFVLRDVRASEAAAERERVLATYGITGAYLTAYGDAAGASAFLNALQNYPLLRGQQTNLYKCFLPQAWAAGRPADGVSAFIHQEGIYDDANGGILRAALYPRLRYHFQFDNKLLLFSGISHQKLYSLNVASNAASADFVHITNLYHPRTIDESFAHRTDEPVGGPKRPDGAWNLKGHRDRVTRVDAETLALFASLVDKPGTPPGQARLLGVYAQHLLAALRKLANQPRRVEDALAPYTATECWHETSRQKDGTIRRETRFPSDAAEWIATGPQFYIATPLYKTPRRVCTANGHYDPIDLTALSAVYLPRTNYVPAVTPETFAARTPTLTFAPGEQVSSRYRLAFRRMMWGAGERTLVPAVIPPGSTHVHTVISFAHDRLADLLAVQGLMASLPYDFLVRATGKSDFYGELYESLPVPGAIPEALRVRAARLVSLTSDYSDLWEASWHAGWVDDTWTADHPALSCAAFSNLTAHWSVTSGLRSHLARRQALVELDVLAAQALGLTLEELLTIYRLQFPVLSQYDRGTWYDRNGRIVFTVSKGLPGMGLTRAEWDDAIAKGKHTIAKTFTDDTMPDGPIERTITYEGPFDTCDREADYRRAWEVFEARGVIARAGVPR